MPDIASRLQAAILTPADETNKAVVPSLYDADRGATVTLIGGYVSRDYVLQLGDRLLTVGDPAKEHDSLSNKHVIALGLDGYVCISYSGLAYYLSKPMDQVIAEIVGALDGGPMSGGLKSVGLGLQRLQKWMQVSLWDYVDRNVQKKTQRRYRTMFEVLVSGFVGRPHPKGYFVRPILSRYELGKDPNNRIKIKEMPKYHVAASRVATNLWIGQDDHTALARFPNLLREKSVPPDGLTLTNIRDAMRSTILSVSDERSGVGSNVMAVEMSRIGEIRATYIPGPKAAPSHIGYSPWIVGYGHSIPASRLDGSGPIVSMGGYQVELQQLPSPFWRGWVGFGTYPRKGPPR